MSGIDRLRAEQQDSQEVERTLLMSAQVSILGGESTLKEPGSELRPKLRVKKPRVR